MKLWRRIWAGAARSFHPGSPIEGRYRDAVEDLNQAMGTANTMPHDDGCDQGDQCQSRIEGDATPQG